MSKIAVLIFSLIAPNCLVANESLLEGDYLSQEYIQVLTKSHSALKAFNEAGVNAYIFIKRNADGTLVLHRMPEFHHIDRIIAFDTEGKIIKNDFEAFQKIANDSFSVTINKKVIVYRRLSSIDDFIRSKTIAGTYFDAAGKKYIFTENGKAIFPKRSFDYVVQYSFFEVPNYDMIIKVRNTPSSARDGEANDYVFALNKGMLSLFRINADIPPWGAPDEKPAHTLSKSN